MKSDGSEGSVDGQVKAGSPAALANILVMTENMLELARSNDWETVTQVEETRRAALEACFVGEIPVEHGELFTEALAAMLHMNEELIALLEAAKAEVAIKRTDQIKVNRSVGHYLDVEKSH